MVGVPGSGKTSYAQKNYPNYKIISLDDFPNKNETKFMDSIETSLHDGLSIVIDDTNLTKTKRKRHINVARKFGARIIVIYMNKPLSVILQQNKKRSGQWQVPEENIIGWFTIVKTPQLEEGFDKLIEINS